MDPRPDEPERLRADNAELRQQLADLQARVGPFPPGHFHSPIPDLAEVRADAARLFEGTARQLPGIDRNEAHQWDRLRQVAAAVADLPLPQQATPGQRYFAANDVFSHADALVYLGMLRLLRPQRVVEVGSGFSTALLLDAVDADCEWRPQIACIEPDPTRLHQLLRPEDIARLDLHQARAQDLPLSRFAALGPGDVLFIDSSHIARIGSDVNFLFFEVLPRLQPGVAVHVHDVPVDFEYPRAWVEAGWFWNEVYLLRALLQESRGFAIDLHVPFLAERNAAACRQLLPQCTSGPGTSLWLARAAATA